MAKAFADIYELTLKSEKGSISPAATWKFVDKTRRERGKEKFRVRKIRL